MIAGKEGVHLRDQTREVGGPIRPPAQAFFAWRAVETFNIGLFARGENGDILNFSISQVVGLAGAEFTGGDETRRGSARPRNEETPYGATVRNRAGRATPEF
jgi:hypothetical protein